MHTHAMEVGTTQIHKIIITVALCEKFTRNEQSVPYAQSTPSFLNIAGYACALNSTSRHQDNYILLTMPLAPFHTI